MCLLILKALLEFLILKSAQMKQWSYWSFRKYKWKRNMADNIFIQYTNDNYYKTQPFFSPYECMKSEKTLTCFTTVTSLSQWASPKFHTELNLSVWLSSVRWEPLGARRGFGLLWPGPSSTGATLPTHTRDNGSYESGTEMGHHQVIAMLLSPHSYTCCPEVSVEVGIQKYTVMGLILHNKMSQFILWSEQYWRDLIEKGWYEFVTLTTASICRSRENVLH